MTAETKKLLDIVKAIEATGTGIEEMVEWLKAAASAKAMRAIAIDSIPW